MAPATPAVVGEAAKRRPFPRPPPFPVYAARCGLADLSPRVTAHHRLSPGPRGVDARILDPHLLPCNGPSHYHFSSEPGRRPGPAQAGADRSRHGRRPERAAGHVAAGAGTTGERRVGDRGVPIQRRLRRSRVAVIASDPAEQARALKGTRRLPPRRLWTWCSTSREPYPWLPHDARDGGGRGAEHPPEAPA